MIGRLVQYAVAALLGVAGYLLVDAYGADALAALDARGYVVESPIFLWGLVAIPLLIVVRAHTLSDLPKVQQAVSLVVKAGFVAAIVASLVDVREVDTQPIGSTTVYVVDVSESVPDALLERAGAKVEETWRAAPEGHDVRLVVFAREAREVPLPKRADAPAEAADDTATTQAPAAFPAIPRMPGGAAGQATDVQGALRLAFTLLSDTGLPRIVLVTDGLETAGSLEAELDTASRFGIPVHYRDYDDVPRDAELMVTGVSVPDNVKARVPFPVTATVKATARARARCELLIDGVLVEGADVDLELGDNAVTIEGKVDEGGDRTVAVTCAPEDPAQDRFATNNRWEVPIKVPQKPKVLYVEGDAQHARNLAAALSQDFELEIRGPRGVPSSFDEASRYDLIMISDVPREGDMGYQNMTTGQMRVLERYARSGGGLVFAGGENSFGPGGYGQTHLERAVLPVKLDVQRKQDMPGVAMMLIIDRSGSMTGDKIDLAKEAAIGTLGKLGPNDRLGVIAFDSRPIELVRLQRASKKFGITEELRGLRAGGGTNIFAALDMGFRALEPVKAKVKHIILLTDGQSNKSGVIDLARLASKAGITISTVAVGINTDDQLLAEVAEVAAGNSYRTTNPQDIPAIFVKEATEVTRRALVEEQFRPVVNRRFRNLQMFGGVNVNALPPLIGYVSTEAKSRAEVIMTSHTGEPVLARWRLGLGQVVVWTSDVKSRWAYHWLRWGGYAKFWRQLVRDAMRVERDDPTFGMVADVADGVLTVGIDAVDEDDRFIDGVESEVTIVDPTGEERQVTLTQTAAGRYEAKVPVEAYGPYRVRGVHRHMKSIEGSDDEPEEMVHRSETQVAWPFPQEHLVGLPDLSGVARLAEATGGARDPVDAVLFDVGDARTESRTPLWPYPLYVALALLLLDVLLRRVRFYGRTRLRWQDVRGR